MFLPKPCKSEPKCQTCQTEAPGLEVKFIWECSGVAVVDMGVSKNRGTPKMDGL